MNKKTLLAYIVIIGCIVLLIGSYTKWKDKLSSFHGESGAEVSVSTPPVKSDTDKVDKKDDENMKPELDGKRLLTLTANLDEDVQNVFRSRHKVGDSLEFLIVGSTAMEDGKPGYAELLKTALEEAYGNFVDVTIGAFDGTSKSFIENVRDEIDLDKEFDVILFEPFTLNNNGKVIIEDEHRHINLFLDLLQSNVEDAVIVLHPPHPIHRATYYPTQVSALQNFAVAGGIPYINHWPDWPDKDSDELLEFIDERSMPSKNGARVWANALISYFVAE